MLHGEAVKIANQKVAEWRQAFAAKDAKAVAGLYSDDAFLSFGALDLVKGRIDIEGTVARLIAANVAVEIHVEDVAHARYDHFVVSGVQSIEIVGGTRATGTWGGAFVQQRGHWVMALHMADLPLSKGALRLDAITPVNTGGK